MHKVAEAEGAVAKLTEQLASSEARVEKLEGIVKEQRRTLEDFKDQMGILVSKLLERDSNVGQSLETVEKWLNWHCVRATLPSALNVINASSVGKLVQLVTASRLILNHKGQVNPMKDECHYQIKH